MFAILGWIVWDKLNKRSRRRKGAGLKTRSAPPEVGRRSEPIRLALDLSSTPVGSVPLGSASHPRAFEKGSPNPLAALSDADRTLAARHRIEAIGDRFRCRGYTFATFDQALQYVRRLTDDDDQATALPLVRDARSEANEGRLFAHRSPEAHALREPSLAFSAEDLVLVTSYNIEPVEGGYRCRGYRFSAPQEAIAYARRLNSEAVAPLAPNLAPTVALSDLAAVTTPSSVPSARPSTKVPTGPTWRGDNSSLIVGGIELAKPMIYTGVTKHDWDAPRHLVDPTLEVAPSGGDVDGVSLGYCPSYHGLSPIARRTYLTWLSQGRPGGYGIGYVFLFFYGLERRLLTEKGAPDGSAIVAEVERLVAIYGENPSFRGYARRLLSAAGLVLAQTVQVPELSVDIKGGDYEMPFPVRRYLGERLAAGEPFGADDALRWILTSPETYLHVSGRRCFDELVALWRLRFNARHPKGLRVRAPKRQLTATYRSASSEFQLELSVGDLPDIAAISAPLNGLRDLLTSCQNELDGLSRLLLRDPNARSTLEGALSLPPDLVTPQSDRLVAPVQALLTELASPGPITLVETAEVLAVFGIKCDDGKITAAQQKQFARMMDRLGHAFEPDRRHSEISLTSTGTMVLYRGRTGRPQATDRTAYVGARAMVEIAVLAAASDGEVVEAELNQISQDLARLTQISTEEQERLLAHAIWLSRDPPRQQGTLKRLAQMPVETRTAATHSAFAAVVADGRILPAEVRFLEQLHKALGLPEAEVYVALHRGTAGDGANAIETTDGVGAAHDPKTGDGDFDLSRLRRLRQETSDVSALLSTIFQDDEPVATDAPIQTVAPGCFVGLDDRHGALLADIAESGRLSLEDVEMRARALKLLPSGALETINEWAFDVFGEALLDEDEEVVVVDHLRTRLTEMEIAA